MSASIWSFVAITAATAAMIAAHMAQRACSEAASRASVAMRLASEAIESAFLAIERVSSSRVSARAAVADALFFSSNSSHSAAHSLRGEFQTRWRSLDRTSASPRETNVSVNSSKTVGGDIGQSPNVMCTLKKKGDGFIFGQGCPPLFRPTLNKIPRVYPHQPQRNEIGTRARYHHPAQMQGSCHDAAAKPGRLRPHREP